VTGKREKNEKFGRRVLEQNKAGEEKKEKRKRLFGGATRTIRAS